MDRHASTSMRDHGLCQSKADEARFSETGFLVDTIQPVSCKPSSLTLSDVHMARLPFALENGKKAAGEPGIPANHSG